MVWPFRRGPPRGPRGLEEELRTHAVRAAHAVKRRAGSASPASGRRRGAGRGRGVRRTLLALATAATDHEVRRGDTLWSISRQYGSSVAAISNLNRLADVSPPPNAPRGGGSCTPCVSSRP